MEDIERLEKAAKPKVPMNPVGVIGLKASSGLITEEFLSDLQWPDAGRIYQEMAYNDAVIGGCLYLIETLISQAQWKVQPATQESVDVEAALFVEQCMHDMSISWNDFISEALSMLVYGFSFHEVVYKTRRGPLEKDKKFKSKFSDGKIGWQMFATRSQATLDTWVMNDATGELISFRQDPGRAGINAKSVDIPIEGNLLLKTKSNRGNPEGWSLLRRAYRSWYFKRYIEELEGIGIERNLAGLPVLQPDEETQLFDPNNEDMKELRNWAEQLVNDIRVDKNHGVIIPGGWTLSLLGTSGAGASKVDTDTVIRRYENRMAQSMLSDLILLGGDRTGSFALAETKQNLLVRSLSAIIGTICTAINDSLIPTLFAVNNQQLEAYPQIEAGNIMPVSANNIALMLRAFGLNLSRDQKLFNYLLKTIQAPELSVEEYTALINAQEKDDEKGTTPDKVQDTTDNTLKQTADEY